MSKRHKKGGGTGSTYFQKLQAGHQATSAKGVGIKVGEATATDVSRDERGNAACPKCGKVIYSVSLGRVPCINMANGCSAVLNVVEPATRTLTSRLKRPSVNDSYWDKDYF